MQLIERRIRRAVAELNDQVALYQRYQTADATVVEASLQQIGRALEAGEADPVQMALVQSRTLSPGWRAAGLFCAANRPRSSWRVWSAICLCRQRRWRREPRARRRPWQGQRQRPFTDVLATEKTG